MVKNLDNCWNKRNPWIQINECQIRYPKAIACAVTAVGRRFKGIAPERDSI
jgi:hypothetical protein